MVNQNEVDQDKSFILQIFSQNIRGLGNKTDAPHILYLSEDHLTVAQISSVYKLGLKRIFV
jgi:hypothetical protein